jgi:hypothetical protein
VTAKRPDDDDRRTRANVAAVVAVLLLVAGAYWLMRTLDERNRLLNCIASGRHNCVEPIAPTGGG